MKAIILACSLPLAKLFVAVLFYFSTTAVYGQRLSRDQNVQLLTNQLGYRPSSSKTCLAKGLEPRKFEVVEIESGKTVFTGSLVPHNGDFGSYSIGDFSKVIKEGRYYLRADTLRSYPFTVSSSVYQPVINMIVGYFSKQRCGASSTGYLSPCHLDDGIRVDNGVHQDVTGGWHDASDLRKWVSATLYGVIGLAKAYELQPSKSRDHILDELRWGNQYFLKMQEPDGYVMDFVGGDLQRHSDNNRWTNNKIEKGNTNIRLVTPNAGTSNAPMLVSGSADDRVIQTQPVEMIAQFNFVTAQAMVARIFAQNDRAYSRRCLSAAEKCFKWCMASSKDTSTGILSSALLAAVELYRTTKNSAYQMQAAAISLRLADMQAKNASADTTTPSGFFYTSLSNHQPHKTIWEGCQAFIALCDMIKLFPADENSGLWKSMVKSYAEQYILKLARKNTFGIVPWGLYEQTDPGGNRKAGAYWYRYFMQPELEWWVGINSNLASTGVGLIKAAAVLNDERMKNLAQKQLDWILGSNPLNSSTLIGAGYNHPEHFAGSTFDPKVPVINGAVMNGLGGDKNDMPVIGKGSWQISEYWTPMVAYTLWLLSEFSAAQ